MNIEPTADEVRPPPSGGRVVMLVYGRAEVLDIAGPLDILAAATSAQGDNSSAVPLLVSEHGGPVATWPSGIEINTRALSASRRQPIDTLVVPGGIDVEAVCANRRILAWLNKTAPRARRVVSVCTGAFLLAAAGLLDGRRVTTHWRYTDALAKRYPDIEVAEDSIYVRDGNVFTSAGITAGMDLALHLVELDHGRERALAIARDWLIYARRPGGQSQFSALLPEQNPGRPGITELCEWIAANPRTPHSVDSLAARCAMSPRHFARVFREHSGMTPARYVETIRLETARRSLESGTRSLDQVASACGMRDAEHLRRAFQRRLGVSPSDYRERFEAGSAPA